MPPNQSSYIQQAMYTIEDCPVSATRKAYAMQTTRGTFTPTLTTAGPILPTNTEAGGYSGLRGVCETGWLTVYEVPAGFQAGCFIIFYSGGQQIQTTAGQIVVSNLQGPRRIVFPVNLPAPLTAVPDLQAVIDMVQPSTNFPVVTNLGKVDLELEFCETLQAQATPQELHYWLPKDADGIPSHQAAEVGYEASSFQPYLSFNQPQTEAYFSGVTSSLWQGLNDFRVSLSGFQTGPGFQGDVNFSLEIDSGGWQTLATFNSQNLVQTFTPNVGFNSGSLFRLRLRRVDDNYGGDFRLTSLSLEEL